MGIARQFVTEQPQSAAEFDRSEAHEETFIAAGARVILAAHGRFQGRITQHRLAGRNLRLVEASQDHLRRIEQPACFLLAPMPQRSGQARRVARAWCRWRIRRAANQCP